MPDKTRRNIGASVRARLLARARTERADFQVLLTRYALERLLYRIGISPYRDRFILKGAMLLTTWIPNQFRPTRDLDLLGYGDPTPESLVAAFREICTAAVEDDGVVFDATALNATPIRDAAEYGGVRVRTTATISGARVPIQIDIGIGDAVTPAPIEIYYPTLLDAPAPHLRAYPVETVIAEKFEALVVLGIVNSRMKDFYDLWLIAQMFRLQRDELATAIDRTFTRRQTAIPASLPAGLSDIFAAEKAPQWQAFIGRQRMAPVPADFGEVILGLRSFLMPLVTPAQVVDQIWSPGGPWHPAPPPT